MRTAILPALLLLLPASLLADEPKIEEGTLEVEAPTAETKPIPVELATAQAEREAAFQKLLTGVRLTGSFTIVGQAKPPKEESYEISKLTKVNGDQWLILARAKWGKNDVTLPFPVRVVWADDTPMITLTNVGFPGLSGKFGCRVLFHGDRYAGTWQHGAAGGHMFGTIAKIEAEAEKTEPAEKSTNEESSK